MGLRDKNAHTPLLREIRVQLITVIKVETHTSCVNCTQILTGDYLVLFALEQWSGKYLKHNIKEVVMSLFFITTIIARYSTGWSLLFLRFIFRFRF